jgi:preprotein translocase subunit SecG
MGTFLLVLLTLVSAFLMFVVLIQRGRGGGLAGAFGGAGGQSAFGTKAGDMFTWITVWAGIAWVVLAILAGWRLRVDNAGTFEGSGPPAIVAPGADKDKKSDADDANDGDVKKASGKKDADDKKADAPKSDVKTKAVEKEAETKASTPAKTTETSAPAKSTTTSAPVKTETPAPAKTEKTESKK